MSTEVNELGDLIEKMLEQQALTFKQNDVVQEFGDDTDMVKVHYSLAIRITKVELSDGEVISYV